MADVIASGRWKNHKVNYFNLSSEVLNRTSSPTCGRWYLPTFLFRDGSRKDSLDKVEETPFWDGIDSR